MMFHHTGVVNWRERSHDRSHALFEWFARQADIVLVFDNTASPAYAAGKAGEMRDLADLDRLPGDLAPTVQRLAG
jgi:hypothetical protein